MLTGWDGLIVHTFPYEPTVFKTLPVQERRMPRFIMTAFGSDRPGVVADVTELVYEHDCNLEDSTMTRLADEFAIILLFTDGGEDIELSLTQRCRRLEREKGITAFIRPVGEEASEKPAGNQRLLLVSGIDHTGIVYRISRFLAERDINIRNLTFHREFLPESGTAMYRMEILLKVPADRSHQELQELIPVLEDQLQVDIRLE
jgi:glycine cleavage system transcriptional repressor